MTLNRHSFLLLGLTICWGAAFAGLARAADTAAPGSHCELRPADERRVEQLLAAMTLAEKVGQMTQAELSSLDDLSPIAELSLGSVLCGGNSDPPAGNSVEAWADVNDACQRQALQSRLKIPLLFGIDAMHGHSNVLGATIFPHNVGLGCTRNPQLIEAIGRATALEVRATGINWAFAPCITVPRDDRWGRSYEGYGESPSVSGPLGAALIRGLQGPGLDDPQSVLACAKHFLGDGGTSTAMVADEKTGELRFRLDQGDTQVDEDELRSVHLAPYHEAFDAGVGSVMASYNSWNGLKCTANRYLLTDVLKGELGFSGIVISDYNAIAQTDDDFREAVKKSVLAGIDMAMEPDEYRRFIDTLVELVEAGEVPQERIDDAVRRILRVKAAMGLLGDDPAIFAQRELIGDAFGQQAHRELARRAVRESLVLLKNDDRTLPLSPDAACILVTGAGADDLGMQCGGWTIDWQGALGSVTTGGTTILEAMRQAADDPEQIVYAPHGRVPAGKQPSAVVVVVGEPPYAEFEGDDADLAISTNDQAAVRRAAELNVPVVLVVLSGRPLVLGDAADSASAIVAAWLPGTEGAGVADILLGLHKPTGKLSFSWPRTAEQHPINSGDDPYDPLYPFGFGLTYR